MDRRTGFESDGAPARGRCPSALAGPALTALLALACSSGDSGSSAQETSVGGWSGAGGAIGAGGAMIAGTGGAAGSSHAGAGNEGGRSAGGGGAAAAGGSAGAPFPRDAGESSPDAAAVETDSGDAAATCPNDALPRYTGSCTGGCPAGTVCVIEIGGVAGGGGEYCATIPPECVATPTCACFGACACGLSFLGRTQLCDDNPTQKRIECDNGIR